MALELASSKDIITGVRFGASAARKSRHGNLARLATLACVAELFGAAEDELETSFELAPVVVARCPELFDHLDENGNRRASDGSAVVRSCRLASAAAAMSLGSVLS